MSIGLTPKSVASGRVAIVAAATLWVGGHCALALSFVGAAQRPWWFVVSMSLGVLASFVAVRAAFLPEGHPSTRITKPEAWLLVIAPSLTQALNLWSIEPAAYGTYANFASGGMCLQIMAIMFRGSPGFAVLAAASQVVVLFTGNLLALGINGASLQQAALLSVSPVGAIGLSAWASWAFSQTRSLAGRYRLRAATEAADEAAQLAWNSLRQRRLAELQETTLPVLQRIAAGDTSPALVSDASALALEVRDGLRARALLTPEIRAAIRSIRTRGGTVTLTSETAMETPEDEAVDVRRRFALDVLLLPGLVSATIHVSTAPEEITAVVTCTPETMPAHQAALVDLGGDPAVEVFTLDEGEHLITWSLHSN